MKRSMVSMTLISACLLGGPLQIAACSGGPSGGQETASTGTLRMPLVTEANGHTYRLSASIGIYGPTYTYLYTSDDPAETVLTTTLQTGNYTAYLNYWTLERQDDSGVFQPVAATLTSDYYVGFSIYNQSSTTISFQFETDGIIVMIGQGQLNIKVGVNEVAPACTILGNDCPAGSWCPPPGLTGMQVTCIPEGWVALGEACQQPTDCVATASCVDLGSGPVCAGICSATDVGTPCAVGGTCTQSSADYGVCVPSGGTLPDAGAGGGGGAGGYPSTGGTSGYGVGGKTIIYVTTGGAVPFGT